MKSRIIESDNNSDSEAISDAISFNGDELFGDSSSDVDEPITLECDDHSK